MQMLKPPQTIICLKHQKEMEKENGQEKSKSLSSRQQQQQQFISTTVDD